MLKKIILGLGFSTATAIALAQMLSDIHANPNQSAYLEDGRGVVLRSPYGLCWRSGPWTPADAVPGCDGELVLPVAKPIAPAIVSPAAQAEQSPPKRCDFTFTLSNDEAFAFDKTSLSNTTKKRIDDEVLPKLANCAKIDAILITGHADRLGSQQYNQRLSEQRAATVAAYLKSKGITAEIDTLGAGKTQPVQSCSDKMPRKKLLECLAPNRRIVIETRGIAK